MGAVVYPCFPASAFLGEAVGDTALTWQCALQPSAQGSVKAHHLRANVATKGQHSLFSEHITALFGL